MNSEKQKHSAVVQAMRLKWQMENLERQHIYFRGHTDALAYLKEIGAKSATTTSSGGLQIAL